MVVAVFHPNFKKIFSKIRDNSIKKRMIKQFRKIKENPEIGKPMKYSRKGTRELYIKPYRLSYLYEKDKDKIIFLDLYHKKEQ